MIEWQKVENKDSVGISRGSANAYGKNGHV